MPQDSRRKLYDALSQNYDLGTFDEFNKKMDVPDSRRRLYDAVSESFDLGTFDEFEGKIGSPRSMSDEDFTNELNKMAEERKQPRPTTYQVAQPSTEGYNFGGDLKEAPRPKINRQSARVAQSKPQPTAEPSVNSVPPVYERPVAPTQQSLEGAGGRPMPFDKLPGYQEEKAEYEKAMQRLNQLRYEQKKKAKEESAYKMSDNRGQAYTPGQEALESTSPYPRAEKESLKQYEQKRFDDEVSAAFVNYDTDNIAEQVWNDAEERTREAQAKHNDEIWGNYASMGGGREMRMMASGEARMKNMADYLTEHDLKRLADNAWQALGAEKQEAITNDIYAALMKRYPNADANELYPMAREIARQQSDQRMFELAVEKNAPKSATDFFFRKVLSQNMIYKLEEALGRAAAGTTGDMEARDMAMQRYADDGHKFLGFLGTAAGMGLDPMMWISAGVGGAAARGVTRLGGKVLTKKGGEAAMREFGSTLGGRLLTGAAGGAGNFATFEALGEGLEQLRYGGARNEETGEIEGYDIADILKAGGRGLLLGAGTGVVAPLIGNVSDDLVRSIKSTGGKLASRAGQVALGKVAEGTIFSVPEWIEGERDAMDVWTDNMAMMLAFGLQGAVKSAPKRIAELSKNPNSKAGFETRLRTVLDGRPDLALSESEKAELKRNGYGDLTEMLDQYKEWLDRKQHKAGAVFNEIDQEGNVMSSVELPYNRFAALMDDGNVSEAARAKMYYYLTGQQLPMSTVMGPMPVIEHKDANGKVTGYTVRSVGANGVITSRDYSSKAAADAEVERINRQAELNSVDVGEKYYDSKGEEKRMRDACEVVAQQKGVTADALYKMMQRQPEEMSDVEKMWASEIVDEYTARAGETYYSLGLREDINNKYGVDVDKAIAKEPNRRSDKEKAAVKEYIQRLFGEKMLVEVEETPYERGYNADPEERKKIFIEAAAGTENEEASLDGVRQKIENNADYQAAMMREEVKMRSYNADGSEHPVELKDGNTVYLKDGNIVTAEDGSVDIENSDQMVTVYDPIQGKNVPISPIDIKSMGEVRSAEDIENEIMRERDALVQSQLDDAQNKITVGTTFQTEEGVDAQVVAINGDDIIYMTADGQQGTMPLQATQELVDAMALENLRTENEEGTENPSDYENQNVNGSMVAGVPEEYVPNMELTIKDEDGNERNVVVTGGRARMTEAGYEDAPDGSFVELYNPENGNVEYIRKDKLAEQVQGYKVNENQDENENGEGTENEIESGISETEQENLAKGSEADGNIVGSDGSNGQENVEIGQENAEISDAMPMLKSGKGKGKNPDFMAVEPERSHRYLYGGEAGLESDEADQFVRAQIAAAEKVLTGKGGKKPPKMSTDLAKYQKDKADYEKLMDATRTTLEYWQSVKAIQDGIVEEERRRKNEEARVAKELERQRLEAESAAQKAQAEEERRRRTAELEAVQDIGNDNTVDWPIEEDAEAMEIMNDTQPRTIEEVAANVLAGGKYRLIPEEARRHTGFGVKDFTKMPFIFAGADKGGISPEHMGEIIENEARYENVKFDEADINVGFNALLNVLGEVSTLSDLKNYIKNRRKAQAEKIHSDNVRKTAEMIAAEDAWMRETTGVDAKEYEVWVADMEERAAAVANMTEEEFNNYILSNYDRRTEEPAGRGTEESATSLRGQESVEAGAAADDARRDGEVDERTENGESVTSRDNDRQGGNGSPDQRREGEEVDENGHPFVKAADGSTTFGEIREESGLPAAPIKLSEGYQDDNGKGYGLAHIEANHGDQIRAAGFNSVEEFVSYVAQNYDEDNIRVGKHRINGSTSYLIQVTDEYDNTLFIELSRDGSFWNVNSGGIFRKGYANKKETVAKTEPQQPDNAVSGGSSLSAEEGEGITSTEPNGEPSVSGGKSTNISETGKKNVTNANESAEKEVNGSYQQIAEKAISDIASQLDNGRTAKNDALIQRISDIEAEAEARLEDNTLSDDERARVQAQYNAASKWMDDNVRSQKGEGAAVEFTPEEKATQKAVDEMLGGILGKDYVVDAEEGQRVLDEYRDQVRALRAYHGSGADFEQFDSSHFGEGVGVQRHGHGFYVTTQKGRGKGYAEDVAKSRGGSPIVYEVEIPEDNGNNYIDWTNTIPKSERRKIAEAVRAIPEEQLQRDIHGPNWLPGGFEQLANIIEKNAFGGKDIYDRLYDATGSTKLTSDLLSGLGYKGVRVHELGMPNGEYTYVIFDEGDLQIVDKIRFHKADDGSYEPDAKPVFYSNAAKAVEGIKQEKATPEQWLKMIEKAGGLKAGEDKWIGLSEWLEGSDKKSLTKQEVMDYLLKNAIEVEEVGYAENEENALYLERKAEFKRYFDEAVENGEEEPQDVAWERMIDKYGDDFELAYWAVGDQLMRDNDSDYAQFEDENEGYPKPINETRLEYTTKGLDNKREIALTVPSIEPWNENDEVHFGDAGKGRAVAWVRFGETTLPSDDQVAAAKAVDDYLAEMREKYGIAEGEETDRMTEDEIRHLQSLTAAEIEAKEKPGEKVLVIDEIQSKRHQEGREKGYNMPPELQRLHRKMQSGNITSEEVARYNELAQQEGSARAKQLLDASVKAQDDYDAYMQQMSRKYGVSFMNVYSIMSDEEQNEADRLEKAVYAADDAYQNYNPSDIPDAPFEKNWHEVAMKRMLRYAAENGYDKIAWTTGEQQADRYNIGVVVDKITVELDGDNRWVYVKEKNGDDLALSVNPNGTITTGLNEYDDPVLSSIDGKNVNEVFGKALGEKIMSMKENAELSGDQLRIGGEGMKGFYDQILPRFMDKYGKKWDVKTEEVQLPNIGDNGLTMWSVDVTPEMKKSVMEGQPMFFKGEDGEVLGYTLNGKVYIDPRVATTETRIHEYSHLWAQALRKANPKAWEQLKSEMMSLTKLVDYVRNKYPELDKSDDEFVEEVFAHYSGKRGAERLESDMREAMAAEPDLVEKAGIANMFHKLREILSKFWTMARDLFAGKVRGVKKLTVEDFADMTLNDLMNGFDPRGEKNSTEEKTLMGVHNISEEKLRKAIKNGGFANPSMAVIDTKQGGFDSYGEISLIPRSSLIDARSGRNAGTYSGDAYTPIYPNVEYYEGKETEQKLQELTSNLPESLGEYIRRKVSSYMDRNSNNSGLEYLFLKERGIDTPIVHNERRYPGISRKQIAERMGVSEELYGSDLYNEYKKMPEDQLFDFNLWLQHYGNEEDIAKVNDLIADLRSKGKEKEANYLIDHYAKPMNFAYFDSTVYNISRDEREAGEENLARTVENAAIEVNKQNLRNEFDAWQQKIIDGLGYEEKLFAGYTPSGYRKYLPNTAENASKLMNKQEDTNAGNDTGLNATRSALLYKMQSLDDIRQHRDLLQGNDAYGERQGEMTDEMLDIAHQLSDMQKIDDNPFINTDYAILRMQDAFTKKDPIGYLNKEYGYSIDKDSEFAKQLLNFRDEVRDLPAKYFETKFKRPVALEEFAVAVVPEGTSQDVVDALKNAGLDVRTYDGTNENRQSVTLEAVRGRDDIRFQFAGERGAAEADRAEEVTHRIDNLGVAREMESDGKDAKSIKMATGWERGADGKWRYEINDFDRFDPTGNVEWMQRHSDAQRYRDLLRKRNAAAFGVGEPMSEAEQKEFEQLKSEYKNYDFNATQKNPDNLTLQDYVEADELFKAYPQLRSIPVKIINDSNTSLAGETITRNNQSPEYKIAKENLDKYPTFNDYANHIEEEIASMFKDVDRGLMSRDNAERRANNWRANAHNAYEDWQNILSSGLSKNYTITINKAYSKEFANSLVHEVQHVIQDIEGFAQGGNPSTIAEFVRGMEDKAKVWEYSKEVEKVAKDLGITSPYEIERYIISDMLGAKTPDEVKQIEKEGWVPDSDGRAKGYNLWARGYDKEGYEKAYNDYYNKMKEAGKVGYWDGRPESLYERLAGEVEARNAARRKDMTAEERRNSLAVDTEDVSREDQIFLFSNSGNGVNNDISFHKGGTYRTKDGVQLSMESLFEESNESGLNRSNRLNGQDESGDLTELRLRKLAPGETCLVERRYEENKMFSFTGKEKIESMDDVAYIFKQLEDAAVENVFVAMVKDGKPTVIHIGMGTYNQSVADYKLAFAAYASIKPDKVWMIHNHPSGVLRASVQDRNLLQEGEKIFGKDVMQDGIIIDTVSGKYGVFGLGYNQDERNIPESEGGEVPIKTYDFSRQVFSPEWNPIEAFGLKTSQDIAEFVSSHRLGEHPKMSFIVTNNQNKVVGNFFLPWTKMSEIGKDITGASRELSSLVNLAGGTRGVLYGNYQYDKNEKKTLGSLINAMKDLRTSLLDVLHIDNNDGLGYHSANDSGVMEPEADEEVMFRERTEPAPKKTGKGYKVFVLKDGKLYPPMVANPNGEATPVGVWLDADAAPVAGLSKTGRQQVKAGGKGTQGGSGVLAYRPGWHLGEIPYALQFNRKNPETGERELFPKDFVWAEVDYADDVDYNEEARSYGVNANGKYQHSLAGLPRVPENGSYKYRTNPDPNTDPWVITGAMKVNRLLTPSEVDEMVRAAGREPQKRQEGAITDEQIEALNAQYTEAAKQTEQVKREVVETLGEKLHSDIEIIEDVEQAKGLTERQKKSKGWYDPVKRKVTVVLENNRDRDDAMATVFHETVQHKGMREMIGEERWGEFLDTVYGALRDELKSEVDRRTYDAFMNGLFGTENGERRTESEDEYIRERRRQVDEMMARVADKMPEDMTDAEMTLWEKICTLVRKAIDKFLGDLKLPKWVRLGENEIRYMLWKSRERLEDEGYVGMARDAVKKSELGLDDDIRFRDEEEEEPVNPQSMSVKERIAATAVQYSKDHEKDRNARNRAIEKINASLADIRKAMGAQRTYDRTTVKRVSDLVQVLMQHGWLDDLSKGEVKRLLSVVKNATGKEDTSKEVQTVMDIMVENQLKRAEKQLANMESIKGSKVDAKGVEVQGALDVAGQQVLKTFKEARHWLPEAIDEAISEQQSRMGSNNAAVADEAAQMYEGLQFAKEYVENIKKSKDEDQQLRQSIKDYDGPADAKQEFVASVEDAIRQNKIERVEAYYDLMTRISQRLQGSIEGAMERKNAEVERIREIQHNANSDMEGRPSNEHYQPKFKDKFVNNSFVQYAFAPLATFDQMLRLIGSKSANGEGYLYNRFMRGWVDAREQEIRGVREKYAQLDAKVKEIFGKKIDSMGDLIRATGKMPKMSVEIWNGGMMQPVELTQGNLMYIYMVNKMSDGRMKLRKMGITEEAVNKIEEALDPRLKELADWIQDEFLVKTRNEYNETHKRVFGANMAAIDNYFPLKILANARADKPEDLDNPDMNEGISTKTGSIIKRTRNALALDITGADALNVVLDHVAQMEHWNAFAEFNRDLNTLRTYKHFRNQMQNMTTIYGSGKELWKKFNDVSQMAAGTYRPPRAKLDTAAVNFAKGVTAAKVSFRVFTALKQFLSSPAYLSEARPDYLAANLANPFKAWRWAMENLPIFEERWKSKIAGDPRLMKSELDWKGWRNNVVQIASKIGMSPNAFVDALTVSIGAHSIYQTKKAQYLKDGYSEEQAEQRAKQDAEVAYNQTQQSSEGAFTSTMQVDRSWLSVMFTVFRNASMSYTRQLWDAVRNLKRNLTPAQRTKSIEFMTKQLVRDGVNEEQAEQTAKRKFNRQLRKDAMRVAVFGYILQFAWNLGPYLPYLLMGDDDDEKQKMWDDVIAHSWFGWLEGFTGGDVVSEAGKMLVKGEGNPEYLKKEMPLASDAYKVLRELGSGKYSEVVNDLVNLVVQMGLGMNPQSITDAVLAIMDACGDDPTLAHEAAIAVMRILQFPQGQIEKIYFDELGLQGDEISNYTPQQLIERYAKYKVKRGHFITPWNWDDEEALGKQEKKAKALVEERMERFGGEDLNDAYDRIAEEVKPMEEQKKAFDKAKKKDYAEAARIMTEIQKDPEAWQRYMQFKAMDKQLDKLVEDYLKADNAEKAEKKKQEIIELKKKMVEELE